MKSENVNKVSVGLGIIGVLGVGITFLVKKFYYNSDTIPTKTELRSPSVAISSSNTTESSSQTETSSPPITVPLNTTESASQPTGIGSVNLYQHHGANYIVSHDATPLIALGVAVGQLQTAVFGQQAQLTPRSELLKAQSLRIDRLETALIAEQEKNKKLREEVIQLDKDIKQTVEIIFKYVGEINKDQVETFAGLQDPDGQSSLLQDLRAVAHNQAATFAREIPFDNVSAKLLQLADAELLGAGDQSGDGDQ